MLCAGWGIHYSPASPVGVVLHKHAFLAIQCRHLITLFSNLYDPALNQTNQSTCKCSGISKSDEALILMIRSILHRHYIKKVTDLAQPHIMQNKHHFGGATT